MKPAGLLGPSPDVPATVDLGKRLGRPILLNPDGGYSTERTITVNHPLLNGGMFTVIPTIANGGLMSPARSILQAILTGEHYGGFKTNAKADESIKAIHELLSTGTAHKANKAWLDALGTSSAEGAKIRQILSGSE